MEFEEKVAMVHFSSILSNRKERSLLEKVISKTQILLIALRLL